MPTVILPSTLAERSANGHELTLDGRTVAEVLGHLERTEPRLTGWVLDEQRCLRPHVNVFVNDRQATLATRLTSEDQLYVLQSITGGAGDDVELLIGTKKGLIVLRGPRGGELAMVHRGFAGQSVDFACHDPRTGTYFAAATHGQFGAHLHRADDPAGPWQEATGLAFPEATGASLERVWAVVPGEAEGELWAGVAPAALFHSTDGGRSWSFNEALWNVPGREEWSGGLGGLCLHSICPWPGAPNKLAIGISAAGVWRTEDGGASWTRGGRGLVPRYLPEEAREGATMLCVHNMHRAPEQPSTLYMQFHGGVYRSDDEGDTWIDVAAGLPADFGFPMVVDPSDPDRAWVIPLNADEDRVTAEGKVRVYETLDRGETWRSASSGLPAEGLLTILRQAFCHDGATSLGLYFGATSGQVFGSADAGASWRSVARDLPPVLSVRPGRVVPA